MTLIRRILSALIAALLTLSCMAALADGVAEYDINNPQNLTPEHLYAQSALLVDELTGEVLFSKNSRVRMYPASTTKIMTLLLALESDIPLDSQVTIPQEAADIPEGSSVIPVKPGDETSFRDLLCGFMLSSGNDGANAVAVLVDGSIEAFVAHMNARAAELGCEGTHYDNAHGYHDAEHYTTAQDLATIARTAMTNPAFRQIVAEPKWQMTVKRGGQTAQLDIVSRNSLLQSGEKYYYPDCTGIKTGHHNKAGWCFVGSAERDGMSVICVVLNCENENDKWYDAAKLFEYGFTCYRDVPGAELLERAAGAFNVIEIENAAPGEETLKLALRDVEDGGATVKALDGSEAALSELADQLSMSVEISPTREDVAPVSAGEVMAEVSATLPDGGEVKASLVAERDVAAAPTQSPAPTPTPMPSATDVPQQRDSDDRQSRSGGTGGALVVAALAALLLVSCGLLAVKLRADRRRKRRRKRAKRR